MVERVCSEPRVRESSLEEVDWLRRGRTQQSRRHLLHLLPGYAHTALMLWLGAEAGGSTTRFPNQTFFQELSYSPQDCIQ